MALWTLISEESSSKSLEYRHGARGDTTYGDVDVYDQEAPIEQVQLSGEGFSTSEKNTIKAAHKAPADQSAGIYAATDDNGVTYTGPITSFTARRIRGSDLWEIQITMPNPEVS